MQRARLVLDKDFVVGEIDPRLYGSFVEHLGRVVYGGIYEPGHPEADEQGFRKDVLQLVRELGVTLVRYPGGNFVSGYDWKDGIGPVERRPARLELAWNTVESNAVGTDEFADWAKKAGVEFMGVVNLGTGTPKEAGELVEYCNRPSGTYWSELRRKYGHEAPHAVKLWGLGNEMDGPWQIGHLRAEAYAEKAREAAKLMKWVDPSIELVVCGSSAPEGDTFPEWDRIVLEYTYEYVDYIAIHRYYRYDPKPQLFYRTDHVEGDAAAFPVDMERYIQSVVATAEHVKAKKRSAKEVYISFDEWGVVDDGQPSSLLDALIYGGMLCTLIRHADRVKIACQSLLVNVGGMIATKEGGPAIRTATYYPFQHAAKYGRGIALRQQLACPAIETPHSGEAAAVQSAATYNSEEGSLNLFFVNYHPADAILAQVDLRAFGKVRFLEQLVMRGGEIHARNIFDEPERVRPERVDPRSDGAARLEGGAWHVVLPAMSWNVVRFGVAEREG